MKTKQQLIADVADSVGLSRKDTGTVIDTLFTTIAADLAESGEANLLTLGKLSTKQRAARKGRNPRTGEVTDVPAKVAVKFKPAAALTASVN